MQDNVEQLRRRWSPELTAEAVRTLQGLASGAGIPTIGHERIGDRVEALRAWLGSVFLCALWGYGEKPRRITLAMAVAIVFFGALQYWIDGIPGHEFWAHVYFSGITFLTIGYGDLVPVAQLPRALAVIEGVVGITVLGMLIASWTKKIMYR